MLDMIDNFIEKHKKLLFGVFMLIVALELAAYIASIALPIAVVYFLISILF